VDNNILRYLNNALFHNVYYYKNRKLQWESTIVYTENDLNYNSTSILLKGSAYSNGHFRMFINQRDITRPVDRVFAGIYSTLGLLNIDTIETNDIQFSREFMTNDSKGKYYLSGYNYSLYPNVAFQIEQYDNNNKKSITWKSDSLSKYITEVFPLNNDKVLAIGSMNNYNTQTQIWEKAAFYLAEIDFSKENGFQERTETLNFEIWPNPAEDFITVTLKPSEGFEPSEGSEIQIYNTLGEKVMAVGNNDRCSVQINISDLPKGIYFVKVGGETAKFIKL
jgi:hypothetical protein